MEQANKVIEFGDKSLIKLHGDLLESSTWVLSKEEYDRCYGGKQITGLSAY